MICLSLFTTIQSIFEIRSHLIKLEEAWLWFPFSTTALSVNTQLPLHYSNISMLSNLSPNWWQNDVAAVKKKKKNRKKTSWTTAWPFTSTGNKLAPTLDWKGSAMKANCTLLRNKKKRLNMLWILKTDGVWCSWWEQSHCRSDPSVCLALWIVTGCKFLSSIANSHLQQGKYDIMTVKAELIRMHIKPYCMILKRWRTVCRQHLISSHRRAFKPVLYGKILSYIAVIDVMRINFIS